MSETWGTPGDAVLGEYTKAALYKVTGGQLVQGVSGQQTALYAKVDKTPLSDGKRLRVYWDTTPATSGTFRFSGDTLEWSDPSVTRPQANVRVLGFPSGMVFRVVQVADMEFEYRRGWCALMRRVTRTYLSTLERTRTRLLLDVQTIRSMRTLVPLPSAKQNVPGVLPIAGE